MIVALGPLLATLALAGGLRVETTAPDALCPDPESVRRAVGARVGQIEGSGEWRASYTIVHRPDVAGGGGDVVRLELRDPAGTLRMQRDLPRSTESCLELAQAIALVLDLSFRQTAPADTSGPAAPPDRGPRTAARSRPAPATGAGAETGAEMVAATPANVIPALRLLGGVGAGPVSPAVGVDFGLTLPFRWTFGAQ